MSPRDRVRRVAKRLVLAAIGRPLRCERCGGVLATVAPVVLRGQVVLVGAEKAFVAVDFASMNRLVLRHAQAGACPGAGR